MALLLTSVDNCHVLRSCRSSQVYTQFYIAGISICNVLSSFAARGLRDRLASAESLRYVFRASGEGDSGGRGQRRIPEVHLWSG